MMIKIYDQNQVEVVLLFEFVKYMKITRSSSMTKPNKKGEHIVSNDADTENLGSPKVQVDVTSF